MRTWRLLLVGFVLGLVVWTSQPRAQQPASAFYGIGDVPGGGVGSAVRDATRVGGTIYAVGASTVNATGAVPNLDTPALWTPGQAPSPLVALPNVANMHTSPNTAYAITPLGTYIASQARVSDTISGTNWVRVDRSQLASGVAANLNLGQAPGIPAFAALALSDDGGVVYGQNQTGSGGLPAETRVPVRYELGGSATVLDLTATGREWGVPLPRGTSSDGRVMVGIASHGHIQITQASSPVAFRYDAQVATPVTVIQLLDDGWWNMPLALAGDGSQTVVIGNDPDYPLGQVYLTDAANQITATLGSPNTGFSPLPLGGMTADGVIGVTFAGGFGPGQISGLGIPAGNKHAYIHNSHGWFHFSSVLAMQGIDLSAMGWDPGNLAIAGIRTVEGMDLVFGQGRRRTPSATGYVTGAVEGFVAELPAGVLASFNPQPVPPANDALVGIWLFPANPQLALAYLADGTYFARTGTSFERGSYTLAENGAFTLTTLSDTNGSGFSGNNGRLGLRYDVQGDQATLLDAYCTGCSPPNPIIRVPVAPGSIVGGWIAGDPTQADSSQLAVLLDTASGNQYFVVDDGPGSDGVETGTYTWDAETGALVVTSSPPGETVTAMLTRDELGLDVHIDADGEMFDLAFERIVAPTLFLPAITNPDLEAGGAEDEPFSYTVTATNALSFGAIGLPNGVTIDAATGVISGTPTVNGTFNVEVTVTNTFGDTHTVTFVLTYAVPPAAFYGIGDLPGPGGVGSAVRDATRVSGTIYAVGASTVNAVATPPAVVPNLDTPVLWTSSGSATGTLVALPPQTAFVPTQTTSISAFAITTDAAFIASQARRDSASNVTNWVRVDQSLTNLNLSDSGTPAFAALALSDIGDVIYGMHIDNAGLRLPVRYQGGVVSFPDLSPTGRTWGVPLPRGTSTDLGVDGRFMVGIASNGQVAITQASSPVAFRYDHLTATTTVLPTLTDGWWNMPVALSADGNQAVVIGNSTSYPNGEVYLTNAANAITATLGSPNTALMPRVLGGMTADGNVVAVTFAGGSSSGPGPVNGLGIPTGNKSAYIHNSHGWFHFASVLAAQGVDLPAMGWDPTNMAITGIRTVENMDLVFGQGRRRSVGAAGYVDGAVEGFVAELPAGVLAAFNPTPTPPIDDSIVGAWAGGADPANPVAVVTYLADGTFVFITSAGFDRGVYTWAGNAAGGTLTRTTLYDTNGTGGASAADGRTFTVTIAGDTLTSVDPNCPTCSPVSLPRITGGAGSILGGWVGGNPTEAHNSFVLAFAATTYFAAFDFPDGSQSEVGTYTWNPVSHELISTAGGVSDPGNFVTLSADGLGLHVLDDGGEEFDLTRIVAPSTVVPEITNLEPLSAAGVFWEPLSPYTVTATYGLSFDATNLPAGLSINTASGVISGTPGDLGSFSVGISVTNTFGDTDTATLELEIVAPPVVTTSVEAGSNVTVVFGPPPPEGEEPAVSIQFDQVIGEGGETTLEIIEADLDSGAPQPPEGFSLGDSPVYYEIETTATFTGPVTICFNYGGVTFSGAPRLLHYDEDLLSWVDITTSVDTATTTVCGLTSTFSPFVVAGSAIDAGIGFLPPVSPVAGFRNAVKGGSTVALKFNLYDEDGNEITRLDSPADDADPDLDVTFTAVRVSCDTGTGETSVPFATTGNTSLRYDTTAHQFVQNWKTPTQPGCYFVRVTGEGLLLSAVFSVK